MYLSNAIENTLCGVVENATPRIISDMSNTWFSRAKQRMRVLGKTQEDLKGPLGVKTRGAVGHYLTGRRDLSTEQVYALARELECSIDWLLTGQRPMREPDTESRLTSQQRFLLDLFESLTHSQQEKILQSMKELKRRNDALYLELKNKYEQSGEKTAAQPINTESAKDRRTGHDRRQNVEEVDFERRSGLDRREDDPVRLGPNDSYSDAKKAKKKTKR